MDKTEYLLVGSAIAKKVCQSRGYEVVDNLAEWFGQEKINPSDYESGPKRQFLDQMIAAFEAQISGEGEAGIAKACEEIAKSMPQTVRKVQTKPLPPTTPSWLSSAQHFFLPSENNLNVQVNQSSNSTQSTEGKVLNEALSGVRSSALLVILSILLGLLPAIIAWRKGHSFFLYWIGGALLWIVVLPVAIFCKRNETELGRRRLAKAGSLISSSKEEFLGQSVPSQKASTQTPLSTLPPTVSAITNWSFESESPRSRRLRIGVSKVKALMAILKAVFWLFLVVVVLFFGAVYYTLHQPVGFTDADISHVENSIRSEYIKDGKTVTDVSMLRDSPRKLFGFVKIRVKGIDDVITKDCTAQMADDGKQYQWGCK